MRLVSVRIAGYKRFEKETTLDLTPRVVAIVGPNEVGKSSLLDVLEVLTDEEVNREFAERDFSGFTQPDENLEVVSGIFELEDDDRDALSDFFGGEDVRLFVRGRRANGKSYSYLVPNLGRDPEVRRRAGEDLERVIRRRAKSTREWISMTVSQLEGNEVPEGEESIETIATDLAANIRDEANALDEGAITKLRAIAEALESLPPGEPNYIQELPGVLRELADEYEDDPEEEARKILRGRSPKARVLRESDRQLKTSYPFADFEAPPAPLEHLLALAETEWSTIKDAAATVGNPQLATILKRGNRKLSEVLLGSWRQSQVSVEIQVQHGQLEVYPYDAESDSHSRIEERSDGFRSFLALLAFTTRHASEGRNLLLAIDEAERHLHYNAQVDLVRILTSQDFASQIVYTTHSAACLPEDLGAAVRVIRSVDGDRSKIDNGFWSSSEKETSQAGFSSLLMAMGADAVAFSPARHALMTEGPSDALLLPALFREALGMSPDQPLGFQVAGGLAWTPPRLLTTLEGEAAHVAYLTDSDGTGDNYAKELKDAGVSAGRIFRLTAGNVTGLSIEDFVSVQLYADVINLLLREERGYEGEPLKASSVPAAGAAVWVEKWMAKRGVKKPLSKTTVAEHLLRLSGTSLAYMEWDPRGVAKKRNLLRAGRVRSLAQSYKRICQALDLTDLCS